MDAKKPTTTKLLWLIVIVVVATLVGWLAVHPSGPKEPSYQGRRLSEWLKDYEPILTNGKIVLKPDATRRATEHAINELGTNAIPFLLQCLKAKDSPMKTRLNSLLARQNFLRFRFNTFEDTASLGNNGLLILGKDALPALPALIQLVHSPEPKQRLWALPCILYVTQKKDIVLPVLLDSFHGSDTNLQFEAAFLLRDSFPEEAEKAGVYKMFPQFRPFTTNKSAN